MKIRSLLFLCAICAVASFSLGFYIEKTDADGKLPLPDRIFAQVDAFQNWEQWREMSLVAPEIVAETQKRLSQKGDQSKTDYKLPEMGDHFWTRKGWAQRVICRDAPKFAKPLLSKMTSRYGRRSNPFGKYTSVHSGIDYRGPVGMPIRAAAKGIVSYSRKKGRYGKTVIVTHKNGFTTLYGHLSDYGVKEGDRVVEGQTIGYVGRTGRVTGPHLHFEVRCYKVPVNPLVYMKKPGRKALVSVLRRNYNKAPKQRYLSRKRRELQSRQRASLNHRTVRELHSGAF